MTLLLDFSWTFLELVGTNLIDVRSLVKFVICDLTVHLGTGKGTPNFQLRTSPIYFYAIIAPQIFLSCPLPHFRTFNVTSFKVAN